MSTKVQSGDVSFYPSDLAVSLNNLEQPISQLILDAVPAVIVVHDLSSDQYIFVNKAIKKLLGFEPEEFLLGGEQFVNSLVHPDDFSEIMEKNSRALHLMNKKGASRLDGTFYESFEYRMKDKKGKWHWLKTDGAVFKRDQRDKITQVLNISVDITERKEKELKALEDKRKSGDKFIDLAEKMGECFITLDKNLTFLMVNHQAASLLGKRQSELVGKKIPEIFPSADKKTGFLKKAMEAIKKNEPQHYVEYSPSLDKWVEGRCYPQEGGVSFYFRDVTERMKNEQMLRNLASISQSIPDAIIATDLEYTITSWNKEAENLYGWKAQEVIGKKTGTVINTKFEDHGDNDFRSSILSRGFWKGEVLQQKKDGTLIPILASVSTIRDFQRKVTGFVAVNRDITHLKKAQELLQEHSRLLDLAHDAILVLDKEEKITFWNEGATKLYGWKRNEVLGQKSQKLLRTQFPIPKNNIDEILKEKKFWEGELIHTRKDGEKRIVESRWALLDGEDGSFKVYEIIRDVTDRKQLEETLRKNEQRFRTLIENSSDVITLINEKGIVTYLSPSVKNVLGFSPEELVGKGLILIHPEDLPITQTKIQRALKNPEELVFQELRIKTKEGRYIWIEAVGRSLISDPTVRALVVNFRDITDRKLLGESLKNERNRLTNLVGNVPGVVWEAWGNPNQDRQQIDFVSDHVESLLGYTKEEWLSTPNFWLKIVHPDDQKRAGEEAAAIFKSGQGGVSRFRWMHKEGRPLWVEAQSFVIKDEKGNSLGMRGVTMDISERMELEKRKDEFISVASHELKTPITSVKGYAQILQRYYKGDEKSQYYLLKLLNQVDRLSALVNDLLDVSKIQSGKLSLTKELFDMNGLIQEVIEELEPTLSQQKIIFEPKASRKILADRYRISQVLINLISNALKYSPKSDKVLVTLQSNTKGVTVNVQDFGIGISYRDKAKIFQPFYQASNKIRQSYSGLGLGLYIVTQIIGRHGGTITVESEKGRGSTFSFFLPFQRR